MYVYITKNWNTSLRRKLKAKLFTSNKQSQQQCEKYDHNFVKYVLDTFVIAYFEDCIPHFV